MPDDPTGPDKSLTVFLSYARADEASARRLASTLQRAGYTVWWDALIDGGAAFSKSIAEALDRADAVIVLWSARSVESDWVRDEAAQGRDRHRLIPLSLDGSMPPLGFRQYQLIDVSHWHGRKNAPEISAIERAIAAVTEGETLPPVASSGTSRRRVLLGGAAAAALAGGGAWWAWDRGILEGGSRQLSIAVLPFRTIGGDRTQDYFAEGLTEAIRTALTRIDALRVLAATSSDSVGEISGAKDIASRLDVGFLLTGSVQRSGDIVRIAADLTDGATGFSRWSQSVDRKLTDIFAVQSEIAAMVAQALAIQVATAKPAPGGTKNVDAYEHYLRGRALFNLARDEATDREALARFDLAVATDPRFALAHAARSRSLAAMAAEYAKASELKPLYAESIAAAQRAVELAPELAEGHLALGYALFTGRLDPDGARPSYERAYELGHGNADIALLYALYCSRAGRAERATEAIERAVTLDPLNPRAYRAQGSVAYAARRYADALPPLRRALELNPKMTYAHALAGSALLGLGRTAEARQEFDAEPQAMFRLAGLAIAERKLGNEAAAEKAYTQLVSEVGDSALYQQAEVLAQWGRGGDALARLEQARAVGDSGLTYAATDPLLDPLRGDPRFEAFLGRLTGR